MTDIKLREHAFANMLRVGLALDYADRGARNYNRYRLNYRADPEPAEVSHRYYRRRPDYDAHGAASVQFMQYFDWFKLRMPLKYSFAHNRRRRTSAAYQLDELGGYGIAWPLDSIGSEDDYSAVYNPAQSYRTTETEYLHTVSLQDSTGSVISTNRAEGSRFLNPKLLAKMQISRRFYDYYNRGGAGIVSRTEILPYVNLRVDYRTIYTGHWQYGLDFIFQKDKINLVNLISLPSDDPTVEFKGNVNLKNPQRYKLEFTAERVGSKSKIRHILRASGRYVVRPVASLYKYSMNTGGYTYMAENGRYNLDANCTYDFFAPIGRRKRFNVSSQTKLRAYLKRDRMLSLNNYYAEENLKLSWQKGNSRVSAMAEARYNYYVYPGSRSQDDFSSWTCRYGAEAVVNLPRNWGIATDVTLYTRRGFNDERLNTTDLVWNARVTKSILNGALVFVADGYDLLRQLNNVTYTVNAQARTEVVSNVIPSYILFHVQWRFN
ncbi:MAG: hypothetical protein K2M97_06995, partial [Muribaculaceae bacterium]|nr:hypothetical protein [Muribaculaceae bacterium]